MRTTINLDEQLLIEAQRLTGIKERTALIHEGLKALIERESARRLAQLGAVSRACSQPAGAVRTPRDPGRDLSLGRFTFAKTRRDWPPPWSWVVC